MSRALRITTMIAVPLMAVGLAACGGDKKTSGGTVVSSVTTAPPAAVSAAPSVNISGFAFAPTPLAAKVGSTVTITNGDSVPHTFTADDGSFDTKVIPSGTSATVTLTKAGTIAYHCAIHARMKGVLEVSS